MTFEPLAFLVLLLGVIASEAGLLYLQVILCLLGATAAVGLPALGGATVTPASLFLPVFVLRASRSAGIGRFLSELPRAGVWLGATVVWALLSALWLPRALAGKTQILTVDRSAADTQVALHQLHPVSGNITQSVYLLGNFFAFLAARTLLSNSARMAWFRDAVLVLAGLNVAAALLNLAEFWLGFPSLLPYLRTANYAIFDAYEEAGLVRIQGTFSETSSFATFTLPLFAFCVICWLQRMRPRTSGALALTSLALLLSSTSGTAYTGLFLYVACLSLLMGREAIASGSAPRGTALIAGATLCGIAASYVICFEPQVVDKVAEFFESTVWNKLQSQSGVERTSWNRQAWQNFLDTWGIGVGLGSARASSFPLVLLSNLGIVGALTFLGFLHNVTSGGGMSPNAGISRAAGHAALATLIAATVSGTVFDLGIAFYLFVAAASARECDDAALARVA